MAVAVSVLTICTKNLGMVCKLPGAVGVEKFSPDLSLFLSVCLTKAACAGVALVAQRVAATSIAILARGLRGCVPLGVSAHGVIVDGLGFAVARQGPCPSGSGAPRTSQVD